MKRSIQTAQYSQSPLLREANKVPVKRTEPLRDMEVVARQKRLEAILETAFFWLACVLLLVLAVFPLTYGTDYEIYDFGLTQLLDSLSTR